MTQTLKNLPLDSIEPADDNLRSTLTGIEDLAASIEFIGLLEPIVVQKEGNRYTIVAGHRRFEAMSSLGWTETKCIVQSKLDDDQRTAAMLIENMQRVDLSLLDEREGIRRLVADHALTVKEVAANLGVSKDWVTDRIDMLTVPEYVFTTPKHQHTDKTLPAAHIAMLGRLPEAVRDRLLKDGNVPTEYDIEDRTAKMLSERNANTLMRRIRKDGILAFTEAEIKTILKADLDTLQGDEMVVKTLFPFATQIKVKSYFGGKEAEPFVELDEILRVNLKDYEFKKNTVYVTKKISGFTKWFVAKLVAPEGMKATTTDNGDIEIEEDEYDVIDRTNDDMRKQYHQARLHAMAQFIQTTKAAELTATMAGDMISGYRGDLDVLQFLGIEPIKPVYDGIDLTKAHTWGTDDSKAKQEADRTAIKLNYEQLEEYANKNGSNLIRAAVAQYAVRNWHGVADWLNVDWPDEPEYLEYPDEGDIE